MPGLNELIKFVNAISKEDSNVTKGINEIFLKINNSTNQLGQAFTQNTNNVQQNVNMHDNVSQQEQEQQEQEQQEREQQGQEQDQKQEHRSPRERVRLEDNTRCNTVITNNNKTIINEIFKYEFDNDRLVEGMIFTEVFGKPLSKRRPRHNRIF
jgi:hypothetical protein